MQLTTRRTLGRSIFIVCSAFLLFITAGSIAMAVGSENDGQSPIKIGFAISKSGNMAPFDSDPTNAALMHIKQINSNGGIHGRRIKPLVRDVHSNPQAVAVATSELISQGSAVLILPCDFDLSLPGAAQAQSAGIPALSLCAGDPKMGNTKTIGDFVFTGNAGSDVEGATGAVWALKQGWGKALLLQDKSIEYTKSVGKYFAAEFKQKGGNVVDVLSFPGGNNVNISSQASRIAKVQDKADFVYVASWNPGAATAIRQLRNAGVKLPIVSDAAADGTILLNALPSDAKNIYYTAFACYVYCSGGGHRQEIA